MNLAPRRISAINKRLDEELHRFMHRNLEEEFPYLILDARYEKVREEGVIRSRAAMVALGNDQTIFDDPSKLGLGDEVRGHLQATRFAVFHFLQMLQCLEHGCPPGMAPRPTLRAKCGRKRRIR
jgi:hypothetical protein